MAADDDKKDDAGAAAAADKVPSDCSSCGLKNESDAKYCKGCGSSLAMPKTGGEEDDDEDDDTPPPSDAPPAKKPAPPPAAAPPAAAAARAAMSIQAMLGLPETASNVAIKSAMIPLLDLRDRAMSLTGARSAREAFGALPTLASEAASAADLRSALSDEKRRNDDRERLALCNKLAKVVGAGDVFIFEASDDGKTKTKRPRPIYATCDLETLRGEVNAKVKAAGSIGAKSPTPFEPDAKRAAELATQSSVTDADRDLAMKLGMDPVAVANSRVALMNQNRAHGARTGV